MIGIREKFNTMRAILDAREEARMDMDDLKYEILQLQSQVENKKKLVKSAEADMIQLLIDNRDFHLFKVNWSKINNMVRR